MGNDLGFRLAQHQLRGFDDVVQNGHVLEQVEALKHHADLGSLLADLFVLEFVHPPLVLPVAQPVRTERLSASLPCLIPTTARQWSRGSTPLATSLRPPTNLVSTRTRFVTACAK